MIILVEEGKLQERLVSATRQEFDALQAQIEVNPLLKKQLKTLLGDLPQYRYLYSRAQSYLDDYTLFDLLDFIANKEGKAKVLFSKAGNDFIGFILYVDNGSTISGIKIASFFDDETKAASVMTRDLRAFLTKEIQSHKLITWEAYFRNAANAQYQKAVPRWFPKPKYNFSWEKDKDNISWVYTLTQTKT
jgi:hypothetical protein